MEGRILIHISDSGSRCLQYSINPNALVSSLDTIIPYKNPIYVAKGSILVRTITFKENGVDDGCRIVVFKNEDRSNSKKKFWINVTSDRTENFERRLIARTEEGKYELSRLIDLSLMKAESRRIFQRAGKLYDLYFHKDEVSHIETCVDYAESTAPSTSALPLPFNEK